MSDSEQPLDGHDARELDALLNYLHRNRYFDFNGYKRSSISRRIQRRMQAVGVSTYLDYLDYLEVHPDEFPLLFNVVLINVTGFYRDAAAWASLSTYLQSLLSSRLPDRPVRVWSAGCASGEEAYTLTMLLAELIGIEETTKKVKVYATDIDEEALAHARLATYSSRAVEAIPPPLLERYFTKSGSGFTFHKDLRRIVIFGRHDLVQDAPISRVDLLTCRNTLMYFNAETQGRVLNRLHFALAEDGLLFLGKAEMLLTHASLFTPLDLKLRIFSRTPRAGKGKSSLGEAAMLPHVVTGVLEGKARLYEAAFECSVVAQVAVDPSGRLACFNPRASHLFGLVNDDVGKPFQDLELSYRPAELRSCIDQARSDRQPVQLRQVERSSGSGERAFFDIEVRPLFGAGAFLIGTLISFTDISNSQKLQNELRRANAELEAAHEELQSTSEELETTNEELQSTVEELETTNEELQSTNEELETMNEELQSTNEELLTINEELRQRGDELNQVNAFFSSILASLKAGVAVLDHELLVRAWNHRMEDLWGLRRDEVLGKHFLNLDIGLPIEALSGSIRAALLGEAVGERVLECTNRRGRRIRCQANISALHGDAQRGVIVLIEDVTPAEGIAAPETPRAS